MNRNGSRNFGKGEPKSAIGAGKKYLCSKDVFFLGVRVNWFDYPATNTATFRGNYSAILLAPVGYKTQTYISRRIPLALEI